MKISNTNVGVMTLLVYYSEVLFFAFCIVIRDDPLQVQCIVMHLAFCCNNDTLSLSILLFVWLFGVGN